MKKYLWAIVLLCLASSTWGADYVEIDSITSTTSAGNWVLINRTLGASTTEAYWGHGSYGPDSTYAMGMRFLIENPLQGTIVDSAWIRVRGMSASGADSINIFIMGEDTADATALLTADSAVGLYSRHRTTARDTLTADYPLMDTTTWNVDSTFTTAKTKGVKDVLQEIFNRPDFVDDGTGHVCFIIMPQTTTPANRWRRLALPVDGPDYRWYLYIYAHDTSSSTVKRVKVQK